MAPDAGRRLAEGAGLRGLLAYQWAHPGKQLLFMGQEFGQRAEWSEERGLDWYLLDDTDSPRRPADASPTSTRVYRTTPALWSRDTTPAGFAWIDANDSAATTC